MFSTRTVSSTLLLAIALALPAADLTQLQRPGGLALISGDGADGMARELVGDGRWLVRLVAADAEQARAWQASTQDLTPMITIRVAGERLPLTNHSVNAVILGPSSGISDVEARRVLAPRGELLTDSVLENIPDAEAYGSWPHFKGRSDGQGISSDQKVAPSNQLRWFAQSEPSNRPVSEGGVLAITSQSQPLGKDTRKRRATIALHGRDAFSGVRLWRMTDTIESQRAHNLFAAHELGVIHAQHETMSPVVLRDKYTGEVLVTYDQGLKMVGEWGDKAEIFGPKTGSRFDSDVSNGFLLVHGDLLVQLYGMDVAVLDIASGELKWKERLAAPAVKTAVSLDGERLYLLETDSPRKSHGRWGDFQTSAVAARSLADGSELWRHDWSQRRTLVKGKEVIGSPLVTEVFEMGDTLYLMDGMANLQKDQHGDVWALDPATGQTQWHLEDANNKTKRKEYSKHGPMTNNYVAWNGELVSKHSAIPADITGGAPGVTPVGQENGYALFTGAEGNKARKSYPFLGGNQRCVRLTGTDNYLVYGFNSWVDREGRSYQVSLTRGNCAMPNYPTYGAVVSVFDETCSCYNGLRGSAALVPADEIVVVAEADRLTTPTALPVVADADLPYGPVVDDMIQFPSTRFYYEQEKLSGTVGGLDLTVHIQRHLVDAGAWQYRSDGRIYSMPVVTEDAVYVASTAGTVTCLDKASSAIRWRFLAAPAVDEVLVNGQLENRWPVRNVVVKDGVVYAMAGRHVELNGGGYFWALDASTGAVQQRFSMHLPMIVQEPGVCDRANGFRGNRNWAANTILLTGLAVDESGRICLVHRKWNKSGSRPTQRGYWSDLGDRTGDRQDKGKLDPQSPNARLIPVDFDAWDGTEVNPYSQFYDLHFTTKK